MGAGSVLNGSVVSNGDSIQVFADAFGQGELFLGKVQASIVGVWSYTLTAQNLSDLTTLGLDSITVTVTNVNGSTSEFSMHVFNGYCNPLIVTEFSDDPAVCGTFRHAIDYANLNSSQDNIITFNLSSTGAIALDSTIRILD